MGHDINKLAEVDVRKVAKRLVSAEAPCSAELGKFMDCMKVGALRGPALSRQTPVFAALAHAAHNAAARHIHRVVSDCNWVLRMQRHPQDPESLCAAERAALVACAGRQTRGARDTGVEKRRLARQLQVGHAVG